jgi:hypothetical protein
MALGSVDEFKSRLTGGGARGNLFQVTLANPRGGLGVNLDIDFASFMCESGQLPASTVNTIEIPFRGRQLKIAGDRVFEPWTVSVINDTGFKIRDEMERWMNAIANHADAGGTQNPELYFADLKVEQFDRDERVIKTYTFKDAWPSNVSAIELSYADAEVERFTIEWQYQYWTSNTTDQ